MTLTDGGKNHIIDLLIGDSIIPIINGGAGVDDAYQASDTTLQSEVLLVDACDATTGWGEGDDALAPTLNTTSFQEGTGSINGGSTFSAGDAHYTKTVSTFDVSAVNDKLYFFFYIEDLTELTDTTDAVYVQLGTGGQTNYNKYDKLRNSISNGWNAMVLTVNSPSSVGGSGADEADIDSVRVGFKSGTSITIGDFRYDYIRTVTDGGVGIADGFGPFSSIKSDKALKITYKVLATENNGYDLSSSGVSTITPLLFTKQTFSAINKGDDAEIQIDEFLTVK